MPASTFPKPTLPRHFHQTPLALATLLFFWDPPRPEPNPGTEGLSSWNSRQVLAPLPWVTPLPWIPEARKPSSTSRGS